MTCCEDSSNAMEVEPVDSPIVDDDTLILTSAAAAVVSSTPLRTKEEAAAEVEAEEDSKETVVDVVDIDIVDEDCSAVLVSEMEAAVDSATAEEFVR